MNPDPEQPADEFENQLAAFEGVIFGAACGLVFCVVLYVGAHALVALWRAHHP